MKLFEGCPVDNGFMTSILVKSFLRLECVIKKASFLNHNRVWVRTQIEEFTISTESKLILNETVNKRPRRKSPRQITDLQNGMKHKPRLAS